MFHKIEECPRCFTLIGRGFFKRWQVKYNLKKKGHIVFEEHKRGKGIWQLTVSTKTYEGATFKHG